LVAAHSRNVILGAFVALEQIATYIKGRLGSLSEVTLVCTQNPEGNSWDEDSLFAETLIARIVAPSDTPFDVRSVLARHGRGLTLLRRDAARNTHDFDLCLNVDHYDFVLTLGQRGNGWVSVEPIRRLGSRHNGGEFGKDLNKR